MEFMFGNKLMPSDKLQKEYSQSNLNKELSLPPFEVVNKLIEMSRETYNSMKQRYLSKPLFNFLFNPSIKTEIGVGKGTKGSKYIECGFFISGTRKQIGAGMLIFSSGEFQQSYFIENRLNWYGRTFMKDGEYYEGGYRQHRKHGTGKLIQANGTSEVGEWIEGARQGKFIITNSDGTKGECIYEDDKKVITNDE